MGGTWFSELWEPFAGFTAGADTTGWRTDQRDKSGCGEAREEAVAVIQADGVVGSGVADSVREE